jgi:hypothetical protein
MNWTATENELRKWKMMFRFLIYAVTLPFASTSNYPSLALSETWKSRVMMFRMDGWFLMAVRSRDNFPVEGEELQSY